MPPNLKTLDKWFEQFENVSVNMHKCKTHEKFHCLMYFNNHKKSMYFL